jgi:glycosyltransferase involved in cell wall biosynthesis
MTTVSVITICLNAAETIEQTIRSVREQTHPDIEHVIIDGDSTDGTLDIIERYRDGIAYLVSEPDKGLYHAMNKGIRAATGDVLYFLNADDRFADPEVTKDFARIFDDEAALEMLYGDVLRKFPEENIPAPQNPILSRKALCRSTICHQAIFARKSLFERIGEFDELFHVVSDFDWLYRAVVNGRAPGRHISRVVAVIDTGGRTYTTSWDAEKRAVLGRYYSAMEVFLWRTWPRAIFPSAQRLVKRLSPIRRVLHMLRLVFSREYREARRDRHTETQRQGVK